MDDLPAVMISSPETAAGAVAAAVTVLAVTTMRCHSGAMMRAALDANGSGASPRLLLLLLLVVLLLMLMFGCGCGCDCDGDGMRKQPKQLRYETRTHPPCCTKQG